MHCPPRVWVAHQSPANLRARPCSGNYMLLLDTLQLQPHQRKDGRALTAGSDPYPKSSARVWTSRKLPITEGQPYKCSCSSVRHGDSMQNDRDGDCNDQAGEP